MEEANPHIILVWDPGAITEEQYLELTDALGDLVRACGGAGLVRVKSRYVEVPLKNDTQ